MQECLQDRDCPWPTDEQMDLQGQIADRHKGDKEKIKNENKKKLKGKDKFRKWLTPDGEKCHPSEEGCKPFARCVKQNKRIGCEGIVMENCRAVDLENLPVAII